MRFLLAGHAIPLVLLFLFSLFASQKLLTDKFYTSHDGEGHVIRMIDFDEVFREGQIPVRIAKRIHYGLGYPFFTFNYPFVYYLGEAFHVSGLSYVSSFKALLVLSVIVGSVALYFFTLPFFGRIPAFASAFFIIFAPYKFLNMYVRGNVAESLGFAFIPLLLLAIERFIRNEKYKNALLISSISLLILSHNITAMVGVVLGVSYFVWRISKINKKPDFKNIAISVFSAVLITSFFWLPVVVETKVTKLSELASDYKDFFPTFQEVFYSPWGFGPYKPGFLPGKMSPQIGVMHEVFFVLAVAFFLIHLIKKQIREKERLFLFFIMVGAISLFLALPASKSLWEVFPPLRYVQLPWRFIGYVTLSCSVAAGYLISQIGKPRFQIVVFLLIVPILIYANRNHIRVNQYIDFHNPFLESETYSLSTTSRNEHMPKDAPQIFSKPNPNGDMPPSAGVSTRTVWKSNYHKFIVNAASDIAFRDNTHFFPGWSAVVDGKTARIEADKDDFRRLRIPVPKGKHTVEFFFRETPYRLLADIVSLSTIMLLVARGLFGKKFFTRL
ncbi:MAG: hypothetical protein HY430_02665 [Candidatus Levybacteria bacterium]|nr:hypothetical protein [Candidatus Levybacteria bacterium]